MAMDPRHPADASTVVRAGLGDPVALDRLLRAIQQPLYDHIAFVIRDPDAALDVLQDVLVKICRSLIHLHDPRLLRAWAFRIATRAAVRALQRSRRSAAVALDAVSELPASEAGEPAFEPELVTALPALVAELPPACGLAVRLRYLEQLSLAEVAEALDVPVGTVKSRVAYGVELLRQRLSAVPA